MELWSRERMPVISVISVVLVVPVIAGDHRSSA